MEVEYRRARVHMEQPKKFLTNKMVVDIHDELSFVSRKQNKVSSRVDCVEFFTSTLSSMMNGGILLIGL